MNFIDDFSSVFIMSPHFCWNKAVQHVDALHDDKGLQHVHLELQRLHAEVVEVGEGGGEELPQDVGFLGGAFLQPALPKVKQPSQNAPYKTVF